MIFCSRIFYLGKPPSKTLPGKVKPKVAWILRISSAGVLTAVVSRYQLPDPPQNLVLESQHFLFIWSNMTGFKNSTFSSRFLTWDPILQFRHTNMLETFINSSLPSPLHEVQEYQKHGNIWKRSKSPYKHSQFHPHPANKVMSQTQKGKEKNNQQNQTTQYTPTHHPCKWLRKIHPIKLLSSDK